MTAIGAATATAPPGLASRKKAVTRKRISVSSFLLTLVVVAVIVGQFNMLSVFHANCSDSSSQQLDQQLDVATTSTNDEISNKTKKPKEVKAPDYSFDTIPSRTWKIYEHPFPCHPPGKEEENKLMIMEPAHEGLLFQRPTKVGSTTMTNIVLRLVHNRADVEVQKLRTSTNTTSDRKINELWKNPPHCKHRAMHGRSIDLEYSKRNKKKSFLFSLVREPTKRAISEYFHFVVTYSQQEPTDRNFAKYVIRKGSSNFAIHQLTFEPKLLFAMAAQYEVFLKNFTEHHKNQTHTPLLTRPWTDEYMSKAKVSNAIDYSEIVQKILDDYDFIAVTERMDESLVAMKLLLGLSVEEILYAKKSRSAGSFSNGIETRPCMYLIPSFLTTHMKDFFYTPGKNQQWLEFSRGDALLHKAASASLDRTIDEVFGRERFRRELAEFQNALAYAQAICASEPDLVLSMCDEGGNRVRKTTCYIWGEGCDHKCLNERVPNPIPRAVLDWTQTYGD